jgi:rare lipoprotein A
MLPIVAGAVLAVALVGAAVASLRLGPAETHQDARTVAADVPATTAAAPSPSPSADAASGRTDDRAGRGELRPAPPTTAPPSSPSKSATATPSRTPPSGTGTVVGSGTCKASFYEDGQRTANGEVFNPNDFTAAHKTLAFNTRLRVTNTANGKSTIVRVNDRGPFVVGRCLDLSRAAFAAIASVNSGVANVRYEILG